MSALEAGDSPFVIFGKAWHRVEPGYRHATVLDDDGLAMAHPVDQRAQLVLGFGNTGSFHMAILARTKRLLNGHAGN